MNQEQATTAARKTGGRAYPLAALFVLVAACAVLLAMMSPLARAVADGKVNGGAAVGASIIGLAFCLILGLIVGLHHYRRLRGAMVGALSGAAVGVLIGPMALIPIDNFFDLAASCIAGSLTMLLVAGGVRWASSPAMPASTRSDSVGHIESSASERIDEMAED